MNNVTAMRPDGKITTAELLNYGSNPELDHFQIVCHWKDGTVSCGWSSNIRSDVLVFGVAVMNQRINKVVFGGENE